MTSKNATVHLFLRLGRLKLYSGILLLQDLLVGELDQLTLKVPYNSKDSIIYCLLISNMLTTKLTFWGSYLQWLMLLLSCHVSKLSVSYVPIYRHTDICTIRVTVLYRHTSILDWWHPFLCFDGSCKIWYSEPFSMSKLSLNKKLRLLKCFHPLKFSEVISQCNTSLSI